MSLSKTPNPQLLLTGWLAPCMAANRRWCVSGRMRSVNRTALWIKAATFYQFYNTSHKDNNPMTETRQGRLREARRDRRGEAQRTQNNRQGPKNKDLDKVIASACQFTCQTDVTPTEVIHKSQESRSTLQSNRQWTWL